MHDTILLLSLHDLQRLKEISNFLELYPHLAVNLSINKDNINHPELNIFINKFEHRITSTSFHSNYGVDIAPFLHQVTSIDSERFPFFIKIHSKQSKWGTRNNLDWGEVLIDALIGSHLTLNKNYEMIQDERVGMIAHKFLTLKNRELKNSDKIQELCDMLDIDYENVKNGKFAAGSMFISKTKIFQKYFLYNIKEINKLLYNEKGKVNDKEDSTYCHSLERIFGYIIENENLQIMHNITDNLQLYNKKHGLLHLRTTYKDTCYILEDLNVHGIVMDKNNDHITIQWKHTSEEPIVKYDFIGPNKITVSLV